ncbi:conserved hypothetical protein [Psychromonas ingrahamii 37]|uniref:Uncharacterized protein n=2 Tax=Psychromonas ingrahamii TaxID=357794 RepID=A1SSD9_PSYIN|nr:hypothetical protein [Psychromonas ingrahamii]ABM02404.1 conserved hypothetical protein [Psychromonas ingrahamii 37]BAU78237.1 laminaridextrin phosphorylase [Psychromonas ingrahamii]
MTVKNISTLVDKVPEQFLSPEGDKSYQSKKVDQMENLSNSVSGKFIAIDGDKYYQIKNVDQMAPFFISVVSASDHWLFISSTGCLSAGRIRPENALFPYKSVDYIHESAENTGSKTIVKVQTKNGCRTWEPFNLQHNSLYEVQRNLYKNIAGDKIIFEEINLDLGLTFKYQWATSDQFGFVRSSTVTNNDQKAVVFELLDGIQNILPPNAPLSLMQTSSALIDAYKWNELLPESTLATYSLYAKLSDRAEPAESLLATSVFSIIDNCQSVLLSSRQLGAFRRGQQINNEELCRGLRGAYFIHKKCQLSAGQQDSWQIVANIDQSHADIAALKQHIQADDLIKTAVIGSVEANHQDLIMLMAGSDAYQKTAEEETTVHHYANVLFNNMRGGVVVDQYWVEKPDFVKTLTSANKVVAANNRDFFATLPERIAYQALLASAAEQNDPQLLRLCHEYLPLTFGRRHGDPSRPWNHFEIKLKDTNGDRLLSYQGNWRDIFQNWEALGLSYPHFIKSFISKFVNASTIDGYNPYRITKAGVDWEQLEEDDLWGNIGYWGDHQIIYLLKFLELSKKFQPQELKALLNADIFSYANVPYEIKDVDQLFADPKNTVIFNNEKQAVIEAKVAQLGSDGRLLLKADDSVYLVNLTEKLLIPLLAKLGNLVVDGGIWLNTQRPEWNDANNAIVGTGLSMVTLYYMRRYIAFLQALLIDHSGTVALSAELAKWVSSTGEILQQAAVLIDDNKINSEARNDLLRKLAGAAGDYRAVVYKNGFSGKIAFDCSVINGMLNASLQVIDQSIQTNLRQDGLYNAYNIINCTPDNINVDVLYPMLEGQVAVLSSGVLTPEQAVTLIDNLYASDMFRADQQTFMLYPDRDLSCFAAKNCIDGTRVNDNRLLKLMAEKGDRRLIEVDAEGVYHFNANFENATFLKNALQEVKADYLSIESATFADVLICYEEVFNHQAFTGRSGTMFGYEGLGSIYWHMVSKLLLAVQENYFTAWNNNADSEATGKLAEYYYKVRAGIGFNKTPDVYGAFPTDPYSHTPKQAGAQQPGMTGQVKEEILTRFGELGLLVKNGQIYFQPTLLKETEFLSVDDEFEFIDINSEYKKISLAPRMLAFTYCQVPFVYEVVGAEEAGVTVEHENGSTLQFNTLALSNLISSQIFSRCAEIEQVKVSIPETMLLKTY